MGRNVYHTAFITETAFGQVKGNNRHDFEKAYYFNDLEIVFETED